MPAIPRDRAIELLTKAVKEARADDLVEIHNELFPEDPTTEEQASQNPAALVKEIAGHMSNGLEVEEIVDLWNVIFPQHGGVWFDEEGELLHYKEEHGALTNAE